MRPLRIVRDKAYYHCAGTTALAVVTSVGVDTRNIAA